MDLWATRLLCLKKKYTIDDYVQNGLIRHYDGIQNTRSGHSNSTTMWHDLASSKDLEWYSGSLSNENGAVWTDNSFHLFNSWNSNDYYHWMADGVSSDNVRLTQLTMSAVFDVDFTAQQNYLMSYPMSCILTLNVAIQGNQVGLGFTGVGTSYDDYVFYIMDATPTTKIHLTVTASLLNGQVKMYVNGNFVAETTETVYSTQLNNNEYLRLMNAGNASNPGAFLYFNHKGNMYNAKIYNRILTSAEIKKNYDVDVARFNS